MIGDGEVIAMRRLCTILLFLASGLFLPVLAAAQGGELVDADWGVPGAHVDVTARVRTFMHDGTVQFEVTRFVLGIDPAPHQNKTLILRVRHWNGKVDSYSYPERSTVNLELDPDRGWRENRRERDEDDDHERREYGLRILHAYYGAGGNFVNVTDILQSQVQAGELQIFVNNYTMGGDPMPGVHKWLRVLYLINGERRNVVVDEKTNLQLP